MPHVMSMNPVKQAIPRIQLPEAILEGEAEGYFTDPTSMTGQFLSFKYPAPGHSKIQILYKYGGASLGTALDLVAALERVNGAILGAGGDLQFRAYVELVPDGRASATLRARTLIEIYRAI